MAHEPDEHFGAYLYICPDWAEHLKAYEATNPGKLGMELEGEEDLRGARVQALDLSEELMGKISSYGIIRYSYLDDGDNCCPSCGKEIELEDAVEVESSEAHAAIARLKATPAL